MWQYSTTYPGLAKFITGCITKQVKSSRDIERITGHCASRCLSTVAKSALISRWRTYKKSIHSSDKIIRNSSQTKETLYIIGTLHWSTHTLYSLSGDLSAGWSSLEFNKWNFNLSSLSSVDNVFITSTPIAAWFLLKSSKWSPTKSTKSLKRK